MWTGTLILAHGDLSGASSIVFKSKRDSNDFGVIQFVQEINGVVYPSVDPAIFEIKYPDTDIRGRVMGDI